MKKSLQKVLIYNVWKGTVVSKSDINVKYTNLKITDGVGYLLHRNSHQQ